MLNRNLASAVSGSTVPSPAAGIIKLRRRGGALAPPPTVRCVRKESLPASRDSRSRIERKRERESIDERRVEGIVVRRGLILVWIFDIRRFGELFPLFLSFQSARSAQILRYVCTHVRNDRVSAIRYQL